MIQSDLQFSVAQQHSTDRVTLAYHIQNNSNRPLYVCNAFSKHSFLPPDSEGLSAAEFTTSVAYSWLNERTLCILQGYLPYYLDPVRPGAALPMPRMPYAPPSPDYTRVLPQSQAETVVRCGLFEWDWRCDGAFPEGRTVQRMVNRVRLIIDAAFAAEAEWSEYDGIPGIYRADKSQRLRFEAELELPTELSVEAFAARVSPPEIDSVEYVIRPT